MNTPLTKAEFVEVVEDILHSMPEDEQQAIMELAHSIGDEDDNTTR